MQAPAISQSPGPARPPQGMTEAGMMVEFVDLLSQDGISDKKLRKILAYVELVRSEPD